jgi:hypothetical protein
MGKVEDEQVCSFRQWMMIVYIAEITHVGNPDFHSVGQENGWMSLFSSL